MNAEACAGNQPTLSDKVDLAKLATLCGVKNFIHVRAKSDNAKVGVIPLRPECIKKRFLKSFNVLLNQCKGKQGNSH